MKRLCTICARGGSKGVPGKNVRDLLGRPLIAYSVIQAVKSELFEAVAVSSDSPEILAAAKAAGATLLVERPAEMATDTAGKLPAIRHCAMAAEERLGRRFETMVDLDATSPLRLIEDIAGAIALVEKGGASNVLTGALARRSPYFNLVERGPDGRVQLCKPPAEPILSRQKGPPCFDINASVYVWKREVLLNSEFLFLPGTRLYEMPAERSIDIDTELDFELVQLIARRDRRFQDVW